jgi:hypothetical protein
MELGDLNPKIQGLYGPSSSFSSYPFPTNGGMIKENEVQMNQED